MLYLKIDISKNTHVASLINETLKPLFKAFSFSNTTDGADICIFFHYDHLVFITA